MIGTKLAHYELTAHLGSGGMGEVYQATDSKLGRSVAIKLLPEALSHDGDRAARFEREARMLAALNELGRRRRSPLRKIERQVFQADPFISALEDSAPDDVFPLPHVAGATARSNQSGAGCDDSS